MVPKKRRTKRKRKCVCSKYKHKTTKYVHYTLKSGAHILFSSSKMLHVLPSLNQYANYNNQIECTSSSGGGGGVNATIKNKNGGAQCCRNYQPIINGNYWQQDQNVDARGKRFDNSQEDRSKFIIIVSTTS